MHELKEKTRYTNVNRDSIVSIPSPRKSLRKRLWLV